MSTPYISVEIQEQIAPALENLMDHIRQIESDNLPDINIDNLVHYIILHLCTGMFASTQDPLFISGAISVLECCKLNIYDEHVKPAIQQTKYDSSLNSIE